MKFLLLSLSVMSLNCFAQAPFDPLGLGKSAAYYTDSGGVPTGSSQSNNGTTYFTDA